MCSKIKNLDEYICFIYMYAEDTSRRAENLMKIWFKCINIMVDYGPEAFYYKGTTKQCKIYIFLWW